MADLLFSEGHLGSALRAQEQKMRDEINNSLDENRILNTSEEDLCNYFVEKYKVVALQIDESQIQMDYGDTHYVTGTRFKF